MSSFRKFAPVVVVALCVVATGVWAQETMIEIKNGEVLGVYGDRLVVREADGVKEYNVPEGFRFDMDGKKVGVADLKPGMRLTAMITTTERPHEMSTTEVTRAEVVHRVGSTVVVRTEDGKIQRYGSKDAVGVIMHDKNGKPIRIDQLEKGDFVTATVISQQPPQMITERDLQVLVEQAPPQPVAKVQPQPQPVAKPTPMPVALPKTATPLPLVGLGGLLLAALGAGATVARRLTGR
jgi:hypothetical protein